MKWLPVVTQKLCTACGRCVKVCGLDLRKIRGNTVVFENPERCPGEGICEVACPNGAITMEWVSVLENEISDFAV